MPNFTYTDNVPNPPNLPSTDVGSMQVNTNSISAWASVDHFGFNAANPGGHHKQVYLQNQPAPVLPLDSMNGVFYCDTFAGTGLASFPAWRNDPGGSFLITGSKLGINPSAQIQNGWSFLSGGFIIQWGFVSPVLSGPATHLENFNTPFSATPFSITATLTPAGAFINNTLTVATISATQFQYALGALNVGFSGFYWMAIGA